MGGFLGDNGEAAVGLLAADLTNSADASDAPSLVGVWGVEQK